MIAVQTKGLSKSYTMRNRVVEALKPISLEVAEKEIFGLLGPNGAGKTTLVRTLLGVIAPSSGSASIFGHPVGSIPAKKMVGFLPENHRFPLFMTATQMLEYYGRLSLMSKKDITHRTDELCEMLSLQDWKKEKVRNFSKGMMQRLGMAQALIHRPKILFLDEPTDGIDPVGRKQVREIIKNVRDAGTTVFINSHLLSEVELITDKVIFLQKGEVKLQGDTAKLTVSDNRWVITGAFESEAPPVPQIPEVVSVSTHDAGRLEIQLQTDSARRLNLYLDMLRQAGFQIDGVARHRSTLEDLFLAMMGVS